MGFLYQVLKDVSEKQPYSVGKNDLKHFVESELRPKLSAGREGFSVIETVAEKVREYNGKVKESNDHVKTMINNMNNDMKTLQNEVGKILENNADSENLDEVMQAETLVTKLADEYAKKGMNFDSNFVIREINAWRTGANVEPKQQFKDLNADLRLKITHARNNITHEAERLTTLSKKQKENLAAMTSMISNKLKTLKSCVNERILKDVNELVSKVNEKVAAILQLLKRISATLWNYVNELGRWIKDADEMVIQAIKDTKEIEQKGPGWQNQDNINEKAKEFKDKATDLYWKFEGAKRSVVDGIDKAKKENVSELDKWKKAGDAAVTKAKQKCGVIVEKLKGSDSSTHPERDEITKAAKELQTTADDLRKKAFEAKTQVTQLVEKALGEVKKMDEELRKNLKSVKDGIKREMKSYITGDLNDKIKAALTELTDKIAKEGGVPPGHLDKIVAGVKEYAKGFKQAFASIVQAWVSAIVKSEGVQQLIDWYVSRNKSYSALKVSEEHTVKEIVIKHVTDTLKSLPGSSNTAMGTRNTPRENLADIKEYLNSYAKEVVNKRHAIIGLIEGDVKQNEQTQHSSRYKNDLLTKAIQTVLTSVSEAAGKMAIYFEKYSATAEISNLDTAIKEVTGLGDTLHDQIQGFATGTQFGNVTTEIASRVQEKIGEDDRKNIPDGLRDPDKVTLSHQFATYKSHVDSSSLRKGAEITGSEGTLPQTIKSIQTTVNTNENCLKNVDDTNGNQPQKFNKATFSTLRATVDTSLEQFTDAVQKLVKGDANNEVHAYLEDLGKMLKAGDSVELSSDGLKGQHTVKGLVTIKSEIDAALEGIKNKAETDFTAEKKATEGGAVFTTLSTAITTNLKDLLAAFEEAGKQVNEHLQKLETNIGKKEHGTNAADNTLQKIHDNLVALLNGDISQVIKDATAFKKQANQLRDKTIRDLNGHVEDEVKKAETSLITQANKNYVTSVKEMLQAFADKVQKELKPLPGEIDTDRQHGFKGFMRTLQGTINGDETNEDNIERLKGLVGQLSRNVNHKDAFKNLSQKFKEFWHPLNTYIKAEIKRVHEANNEKTNPKPTGVEQLYTSKLDAAHSALNSLLDHISNHRYNHELTSMLDQLASATATLAPESFARTTTPLLDSTGKGVEGFVSEVGKAYISAYDGETFADDLVKGDKTLTKYGMYYAKVFLTALRTLDVSLYGLKHECKSLTGQKINSSTDLGRLFVRLGFKVSEENKEHWELQNRTVISGQYVSNRLTWRVSGANDNQHLKMCESKKRDNDNYFNVFDIIRCLATHAKQYFEVCHYSTSTAKRQPCSAYEMLIWLAGLPHNRVYDELVTDGLSEPFANPNKQTKETDGDIEFTVFDLHDSNLDAYPKQITYKGVVKVLNHVCSASYDVLTTISGHGDAMSIYGSDFCNNSLSMKYPSKGDDCLITVVDVLRRLLPQLQYLFNRCRHSADDYGWRNCRYGRDIPSATSQCTDHSSDKAESQPKCQPTCQANSKVDCQPTSPLMSYLYDCLPGHLPHQISSIGCKPKCTTCPGSKPGMPCLTPMGFRCFSGSTKTGENVCEILRLFFGGGLLSSLLCLVPQPPSTLPEHFGFALSLGRQWNDSGSNIIAESFASSIDGASIGLYTEPSKLSEVLRNTYASTPSDHAWPHTEAEKSDLSSLSTTTSCMLPNKRNIYCAPYLSTLWQENYMYLAKKHVKLYLSWAVYLPWEFWKYLDELYTAFCGISCQQYGCRSCINSDTCRSGKHGVDYNCKCWSIVRCRGVQSTFYSYGFAFGDSKKLLDEDEKRYCHDFCSQLSNVLNSDYFKKLFTECDEFIFTIRQPFIWLNIALWSLSLFYLICVMVGRLDVLHIRSHLRIPSSHKITAQSLLAAAQVGRLAKISYLQP
ncbi:hypothetical protein, conserved [Babesia bigemina]|uniref:C3H1-type domain-containing protein n=1 Tax=Babesia bigemina TaxID=5866 RepID=A0A061BJA0_BABBI|nr:hypothetical protein, conserved [Babesia bigemina]CDR71569.1 hypothetical protein, conserved [Babesia bigemina]|eukprot:XP_012770515.1 hypothetical protein, conserved [Babesia bigemina]